MANAIKEGGLRLVEARVDQPLRTCIHTAAERLGIGDPVKTGGSSATLAGGPYTKDVALCASGDPIYGVCEGVLREFVATGMNLDIRHAASGVSTYVLIRPANHQDVYAITSDGTTAATDIGLNANFTGNAGGTTVSQCNATSGMSTVQLDASTAQTTATLSLKMIGFEDTADNTAAALNASVLVTLNNIENSGGTGVAGI